MKNITKKAGQIFDIMYAGNGYYRIRNPYTGKVLDVTSGRSANGTNIQQYTWNGTKAQKWYLNKYSYSNKITPGINQKAQTAVALADEYMRYCRSNGIRYGVSYGYPPVSDGVITCGGLCFRVLYEMGYNIPKGINYESGPLGNYLATTDLKKGTSFNDIRYGSIVIVAAGNPYNYHAFIVKSFDPATKTIVRYDAGLSAWINSEQPLTTTWRSDWTLLSVWNFPD